MPKAIPFFLLDSSFIVPSSSLLLHSDGAVSLKYRKHIVTIQITPAKIFAKRKGAKTPLTTNVIVTNPAILSFCGRVNPPLSRKARMYGLSVGCVINQLCQRSLPREKQYAANNKNGVVGNNGKGIPAMPRATQTNPAVM
jgi:hypothetical protein